MGCDVVEAGLNETISVSNWNESVIFPFLGTPEIQLALQGVNDTEEAAVGENKAAVLSCPYIAEPDASVTWMFRAMGEDDFQGITRDGIQLVHETACITGINGRNYLSLFSLLFLSFLPSPSL